MKRSTYNLHRAFAAVALVVVVFSAANYYTDLGFIGQRTAKGTVLFTAFLIFVWGAFFMPSREEMKKQRDAARAQRKR